MLLIYYDYEGKVGQISEKWAIDFYLFPPICFWTIEEQENLWHLCSIFLFRFLLVRKFFIALTIPVEDVHPFRICVQTLKFPAR